jgi:hypothetical protein
MLHRFVTDYTLLHTVSLAAYITGSPLSRRLYAPMVRRPSKVRAGRHRHCLARIDFRPTAAKVQELVEKA